MISPFYLFSYWIFAWFILWYSVVAASGNGDRSWSSSVMYWNPLVPLALALSENIGSWIWLISKHAEAWIVVEYLIMILFIKVLPLYLVLQRVPVYRASVNTLFFFPMLIFLTLFAFYWFIVLSGTGASPLVLYQKVMTSILHGNPRETPMFTLFHQLGAFFSETK